MTITRARIIGTRTVNKHLSQLDSGAAGVVTNAGALKCIFSSYNVEQREYSSASSSSSLSEGPYALPSLDYSKYAISSMMTSPLSGFPSHFDSLHCKHSKRASLVVPLVPLAGGSHRRWMTTTTIDGIKVDITKVDSKSAKDCKDDNIEKKDDDDGNNGDSSSSPTSNLKKSHQQEAEEEIFMLNAHLKEHFQHANYTEALKTCHTILDKSIELFGPTNNKKFHPSIASAYNNMGLMHKMMGDFDESREHYHEALRIYEEIVGKDHASYAAALNNLGNLDRAQSMSDVEEPDNGAEDSGGSKVLSSLERMQLNDSAVGYFEEAYRIRKVELGEEHVYTVTSRTNLGGAIAAQVLQGEQLRQKRLRELQEQENEGKGSNSMKSTTMWAPSKYTKEKWDVAEDHLRAAFRMSVNNPRGEKVVASSSSSSASSRKDDGLPTRSEYKAMSKKEKKQVDKLRRKLKKERERSADAENISAGANGANMDNNGLGVGDIKICTLSSAAAGQNLAVFLKSRADLISNAVDINANGNGGNSTDNYDDDNAGLDSGDMYSEAKNLYLGALRVRTALKGDIHPDTVATKFSLAELIDTLGDEEGANVLRQQLLDAYQVEEREDADGSAAISSDK